MKRYILLVTVGLSLIACNFKNSKASINPGDRDHPERLDSLKFPKAEHYVNDFDDILTANQETELDRICANYDRKTTNQIVVATFKSWDPYDKMETFCTELFNEWGVGAKGKNNGLLIVVFKDLHKVRMEAGLGTEKILTNEVCDEIMQTQLIPPFKEGKMYEGIKGGIEESIRRWK